MTAGSKVVVKCVYPGEKAPGEGFDKHFGEFLRQVERDVLTGTFNDFDTSIFPKPAAYDAFVTRAKQAARCLDMRDKDSDANGRYLFRLELNADLFGDPAYALQRLIHILASDLFERRMPGLSARAHVIDIEFGPLEARIADTYRPASNDVAAIRSAFLLHDHQALLAFTMKPRGCLADDDYLHIVRQAFEGGCQIVELDTRDLSLNGDGRRDLLLKLSQLALDVSKERICRFSVNLSGPVTVIDDLLTDLSKVHRDHDPKAPWVIKVDGNLDGISTIQAIRSGLFKLHSQPIITCYPVLKYALEPSLGRTAFVRMLAMSGADIIYPGQSPDFRKTDRRIDTERVTRAQAHYAAMDMGGYPMLSVAGGVFVNSVHAHLAVLGPNIAFFVGGGIALSKKGIKAGTENFAAVIDLAGRDLFHRETIRDLESRFVDLAAIYHEKGERPPDYGLVLPKELESVPNLHVSTNLK